MNPQPAGAQPAAQPQTQSSQPIRNAVSISPIAGSGSWLLTWAPWLGTITLLGLLLRVWAIGEKGLWLDEAFSIWMSRHPLPEMLDWLVRIDQHPPLYYTLLHGWLAFGDSEAWVRWLSALASTLAIPVFYAFVHTLAAERAALIAAFVLAIAPFHVRFAQEARMYALLTLAAAGVMLGVAILLTPASQARQRAGWVTYVLATVATLLTHNTALFLPVAANLFMLPFILWQKQATNVADAWAPAHFARLQAPSLRAWLLAQATIILLWLPWSGAFVRQSLGVYEQFWIQPPTVQTVIDTLFTFASAFFPGHLLWPGVVWLLFCICCGLGLLVLRRNPSLLALLLVLWLTPFIGEWLVSLRRPIFYDRTLIWASLPLAAIVAIGIDSLRRRWLVTVALVALLAVQALALDNYYRFFEKEDWRGAAAYLAQQYAPGDLLLFNATWVQIPFDYYFRAFYPEAERRGAPVDLFEAGVLEPKMTPADLPRLNALIGSRNRVWLIYSHDWYTDPQKLIPAALDKRLTLLDRQSFYGLELRLYGAAAP